MKEQDYLLVNNLVIIRAMLDLFGRFAEQEHDGTDLYPFIANDRRTISAALRELELALQEKVGSLQ